MKIQKTTGIVLSTRTAGDTDIMSKVLTRDYGKRTFIFKGLRKSRKRQRYAAEPGSFTDLVYYYHTEWESCVVNEFSVRKYHHELRKNLQKIYTLFYILESVEKTTGFNDTNTGMYEYLSAAVDTLETADDTLHFTAFFTLHLLRLLGILPSFEKCKFCGSPEFSVFVLDADDGAPVCGSCGKKKPALTVSSRKFINESLSKKFSNCNPAGYGGDEMRNLIFNLSLFMEHYFHIELNSREFILKHD